MDVMIQFSAHPAHEARTEHREFEALQMDGKDRRGLVNRQLLPRSDLTDRRDIFVQGGMRTQSEEASEVV